MTETVFIFLLAGGVWLYVEYIARRGDLTGRPYNNASNEALNLRHALVKKRLRSPQPHLTSPPSGKTVVYSPLPEVGEGSGVGSKGGRTMPLLLGAAIMLGLAALTRAVLLLFPFGLAIHLLMVYGWRAGLRKAVLLLVVYALVVGTWTVYSVARWNRFVIAGEGLPAFLYFGATGWSGYAEADQQLAEVSPTGDYAAAAESAITADPLGWIKRRVGELAGAYLQPHGTVFFSGASLRKLVGAALHGDQPLAAVVQGDNFVPKLALYLFHYVGLIGGLVGIWLYRRRWQVALPMIGLIAYLTLVHLALYALPRYLFPTEVFWWVFAAAAIWRVFQRFTLREVPPRV